MQHTRICVSRRSVADEAKTADLLHGKSEDVDVGALTEPLAKDNLRVNCVCPGIVLTPKSMARQAKVAAKEGVTEEEWMKLRTELMPLSRGVTMEEIANAALFLVSDRAAMITSAALPVDGGFAAV